MNALRRLRGASIGRARANGASGGHNPAFGGATVSACRRQARCSVTQELMLAGGVIPGDGKMSGRGRLFHGCGWEPVDNLSPRDSRRSEDGKLCYRNCGRDGLLALDERSIALHLVKISLTDTRCSV